MIRVVDKARQSDSTILEVVKRQQENAVHYGVRAVVDGVTHSVDEWLPTLTQARKMIGK